MIKIKGGNILDKFLIIGLCLFCVSALGMLVYSIANPVSNEQFTNFYILGINGKADNYPSEFDMANGNVIDVKYSDAGQEVASGWGNVYIGITNHENQTELYSVEITIDGKIVNVYSDGETNSLLGPIKLVNRENWEQEIGFAPPHVGTGQEVEFILYKNSDSNPYRTLKLWIDAE